MPDSLWSATASKWPANPLCQNIESDVAIIGAGYTGLSAALHLSEFGYKVSVLEAVEPGFGASGRNGGQVIPGLKLYPGDVISRLGEEKAKKVIDETNASAELVFKLIDKYNIDCHAMRCGFIQPAFSLPSCRLIEDRVNTLAAYGAPVELLDKQSTAALLGSDSYQVALLDKRGGSLHPLSYAQGLAKAAIENGASVYTHTPALNIRQDGQQWQIETPRAKVNVSKLVFCTNAYTGHLASETLWSGLKRSIIPFYSFQVATKPLSAELRSSILPQGHVASDTRRLLNYFRLDPNGRLLFGGRGGVNDAVSHADYKHVVDRIHSVFPQIKKPQIDFFWSGRVALTLDGLPHIHELTPGVYTGLGFNGRGVGMATLMGKWLANLVRDNQLDEQCIPVTRLNPIAFQRFRRPVISLAFIWKSLLDRAELYRA